MPDLPRFDDLLSIARDEILARNALISQDAVNRDGSDVNVLLAAMASMAEEVVMQLAHVAGGLFLDSSTGDQLDRYAADRYGLVRKSASGSLGSVTFTAPITVSAGFTIPDGTTLQALDGNQFLTIGDTVFNSGLLSLLVPVRSALAGGSQNERAGQITSIVNAITGAPSGLTVNNLLATAGASDDESDASLRDRCRRFFITSRRGTLSALEAGALAVPGVTAAKAIEVLDGLGRPARMVLLAVSDKYTDQFATLSSVPLSYQTQSQQLAASVYSGLDEYRAAGIYVQVQVAQVVMQPVTLNLTFLAGVDVDYTAVIAKAAIVNYINALLPGASLDPANLLTALKAVPGLQITGAEIQSPLGVIAVKPLQVLRSGFGAVYAASAMGSAQPVLVGTSPDNYAQASG
jgi:uncharacterized phage protein gp47/JayE